MPNPAIQVKGLPEFHKALKDVDKAWPKAMTNVHKTIAKTAAEGAQGMAVGWGRKQAKAASKIRGTSSVKGASVGVPSGGIASTAFWGAKKHTGWYAAPKYNASTGRQHDPWVGNSWEAAAFSGGPYAINRALFFDLPEIDADYMRMIDELTKAAFPNH